MISQAEMTALDRFEAKLRRNALERTSMPSPSGRRTLLLPMEVFPVPPDPPTVRDLSGPPMGD